MRSGARRDATARAEQGPSSVRRALLCALLLTVLALATRLLFGSGERQPVVVSLTTSDREQLGLPPHFGLHTSAGNPWPSLRGRPAGCGGRVNPSARVGDLLLVRYVARDANGSVTDSTFGRAPATLRLGSGQGGPIARWLAGMCAGDATTVRLPAGGSALVALEAVGGDADAEAARAEAEDRLARAVTPVAAHRRAACTAACARAGMVCEPRAFAIVNDCGRLKKAFECDVCEVAARGSAGKDMPCFVSKHAPRGFPRGYCLASPVVESSTCGARHRFTSRLCPCVDAKSKQ